MRPEDGVERPTRRSGHLSTGPSGAVQCMRAVGRARDDARYGRGRLSGARCGAVRREPRAWSQRFRSCCMDRWLSGRQRGGQNPCWAGAASPLSAWGLLATGHSPKGALAMRWWAKGGGSTGPPRCCSAVAPSKPKPTARTGSHSLGDLTSAGARCAGCALRDGCSSARTRLDVAAPAILIARMIAAWLAHLRNIASIESPFSFRSFLAYPGQCAAGDTRRHHPYPTDRGSIEGWVVRGPNSTTASAASYLRAGTALGVSRK
jgi:hypothetical protein